MTTNLGDTSPYRTGAVGQEQVLCQGTFTFGNAGAIASSVVDDPALALAADSGTGVHALTYPKCPEARIAVQIQSAALTISEAFVTAKAESSGTATIKLAKAGTLTQGASGNILYVTILGKVTA